MSQSVTFGTRLKEARMVKMFTQQQLAKELNISRVAYGYYENDAREMRQRDISTVCKLLDISADYLLGLSDTKKPEYAKIAETTGLTQESINRLNQFVNWESDTINDLLAEEPCIFTYTDPAYEAFFNSPEEIERKYQQHLRSLAWEEEMKKTSILKHLENEWAHNEHEQSLTEEERIARDGAYANGHVCQYIDADEADPNFISFTEKEYEEQEKSRLRFEAEEARKSKLLSAITEYVHYQSGCTLYTMTWFEDLSETHPLRIGIRQGQTITFPSKEADELLEFMLLQKVIEALKTFKENRYPKKKGNATQ